MDLKTDNRLEVGDLVMLDALNAEKQDPLFANRKILRRFHKSLGKIDCVSADHDGNIEYEIKLIDNPGGPVVLKKVPRCWFKKVKIVMDKPEEILLTKPASVTTINGTCGFEAKFGYTDYTDYSKMFKNVVADWGANKMEQKTPDKKYEVDHIIYNHPATIVFWKDGTKTVVKCSDNDPYIRYNAFCAALAKKIYGNNSQVNKIVASGIDQGRPQKKPHGEKKDISRLLKVNKKAIEHAKQVARYALARSNDYREARRKAHIERITELKDKQHMAWIKIAARIGLDVEEVKKLYREGKMNG